ncbi:MAG: hypothetical protein EOO61_14095 [Hymenobacter sp.]|nr:MAG: hypothetical protein EOO61_14095 [Hymenobacter sp.]
MTNNADRINWYAAPLLWQIVGLSGGADYTALQALRYNSVSLLDLVLFLWSLSNVDSNSSEIGDVHKLLNDDIASVLSLRFNKITLPVPPRYAETSGGVGDVNLYRSSFFFSEITNIAVWKAQVSELLFADADSSGSSVTPQNPLASPQIRLDITDKLKATFLTALGDWTQGGVENRLSSEPAFFRALIAADIVRSIKDFDNIDHTTLVKILSETKDVHEYISAQGLTKLAELSEEKDDSLVSFLLRDLAFRRRRSLDNDLERRTAFMNIFVGGTHQDIVPFIISLSSDYPSASDYIFSTCSRVFLERLYLLMSSVKDVIETRIALCQWYIDERDVENRATRPYWVSPYHSRRASSSTCTRVLSRSDRASKFTSSPRRALISSKMARFSTSLSSMYH